MKKAIVLPIPVDSPARVVSSMANDKLISMITLRSSYEVKFPGNSSVSFKPFTNL